MCVLRGFQRVHLKAQESKYLKFILPIETRIGSIRWNMQGEYGRIGFGWRWSTPPTDAVAETKFTISGGFRPPD